METLESIFTWWYVSHTNCPPNGCLACLVGGAIAFIGLIVYGSWVGEIRDRDRAKDIWIIFVVSLCGSAALFLGMPLVLPVGFVWGLSIFISNAGEKHRKKKQEAFMNKPITE